MVLSYGKIILALLASALLGMGASLAWHLHAQRASETRYQARTNEQQKAVQQALAQAEAALARAAVKEAQAELLKQQIDARSQSAVTQAQELLARERQREAELTRQREADLAALDAPATECERQRDVCARFARLAQRDAAWRQYICLSDPCQ